MIEGFRFLPEYFTPAQQKALRAYGHNLGVAFQLIDDALDYSATQESLGKTVGDDFREGKITLPVLLAFQRGDEEERAFWRRTLEEGEQNEADLPRAIALRETQNKEPLMWYPFQGETRRLHPRPKMFWEN